MLATFCKKDWKKYVFSVLAFLCFPVLSFCVLFLQGLETKILTVPEGVTINFLAERDSDNFYYYLMPVNVDIFGAETIIENFKKAPPDYILQNNLGYSAYNKGGIFSYLTGFYEFLEEEYTPVLQLKAPVSFTLYKKKSG